ncbi:MAG: FtsX-like permease family protein [Actinomycetota bacterium]
MSAVLMWLRAELRARWKALTGIVLLLGLAGGIVIAAAAGARRTDSAHDRFLEAQTAADLIILDDGSFGIDVPLDEIIRLPQVSAYARGSLVIFLERDHAAVASVDDRLGRTINRFKIIEGRMYDSSRVEEVVVGIGIARVLDLKVGSEFPLVEDEFDDDLAAEGLPNAMLKVVGIVAGPGDFPPQYVGLYPSIHLTPALFRVYGNRLSSGDGAPERGTLFLKLKNGAADVPAFRAALDQLAPELPLFPTTAEELGFGTQRSFRFQATGLWFLALFGGIATILIGGQALARQTFLGSGDFPTLSALGFGRGWLASIGVLRAGIVGIASAALAVLVAFALSPLTPVGDARFAEPSPGLAFDVSVVGLGAAGLLLVTVLLTAYPAWRSARMRSASSLRESFALRPSRVAAFFARASMPASGVAGARLAFEMGRGGTAVPVRSSVVGAAFGLAVLIATVTFGASLNHLIASPPLYGVGWDAFLTHYGDGPDLRDNTAGFLANPGVTDVTIGTDIPLEVGGRQVFALGIEPVRGAAGPPIVDGREPGNPNEIALTSKTARRVHARIGDTIRVRIPIGEAQPAAYTIVGQTVIPPFGFVNAEPGEGALLTLDGAFRLAPPGIDLTGLVSDAMIRFAPGADREEVISSLAPLFGRTAEEFGEGPSETPADVVSFGRVRSLPLVLGSILAVVAAATLAHTMASGVRRRSRDLAILKTLGFEGRQLRATVAWQATVLTVASICPAVPGGIALGRWTWHLLAAQISVVPRAVVPVIVVLLIAPAAILLANLMAAIPGRTAARLQPAVILRTE